MYTDDPIVLAARGLNQNLENLARATWDNMHELRSLNMKIAEHIEESKKTGKIATKLTWALVFVGAMQAVATIAQVFLSIFNKTSLPERILLFV